MQLDLGVSLEEAQERLVGLVAPLPEEVLPLTRACGRILARDLLLPRDIPPNPQAAVDGFAVNQEDLRKSGLRLALRGFLKAGDFPCFPVRPGETVGVVTGGLLPEGTGAVLPHERVQVKGDLVIYETGEIPAGSNIRLPGEDFRAGELVARRGTRLGPGLIAVLAASGQKGVPVFRSPRVGILSLGREIVSWAAEPGPGQVRDSNGPLLAALVSRDGGEAAGVEAASDEQPAAAISCLKRLLDEVDLVLTIGGTASEAGDRALFLLREIGARLLFWGVRIKPGSHSGAAVWNAKPVLSLSGNPAACAVGYELLAAPVVRALQGLRPYPRRLTALCVSAFSREGGPRRFLRGHAVCDLDGWRVAVLSGQKSSMMRSLIGCNALIDLPAGHPPLEPGSQVSIILLDRV